jgi:hypothetical protein
MRADERGEGTDVDARLDAALRSYAEPGEIAETRVAVARVLERVRSDSGREVGFWVWGAVATACLVVAVVVGAWMLRGSSVPEIVWVPRAPGVVDYRPLTSRGSIVELPHPVARNSTAQQNGAPGVLPKLEVFPTLRPLTAEEQALVAFAEQATPEQKKQVMEAEQHLGDPIAIAELKIRPLDEGEKTDSDKER